METHFTFRHLEPTDELKALALKKISKARKYLLKPIAAHIIFSLDKFRKRCDVTIVDSGMEYIGSETATDMRKAVERAVARIVTQLKKKKEKVKGHKAGRL